MKHSLVFSILILCSLPRILAQQSSTRASSIRANTAIPALINFNGTLTDLHGKSLTEVAGVTFLLYRESQGGAPLWMETQNVHPDKAGHYSVVLGSSSNQGLPQDLFASGEARWLGLQVAGQDEQPRVLLVAVPYALKARDAETIGGLPPSAFVLAAQMAGSTSATASVPAPVPPPATITGSGTTNFVPLWTGAATVGDSFLFQSGTGSTAKVGINTITPSTTLDVKGAETVRGVLTLPAGGVATATAGKSSQPLSLTASAFNSGTAAAVNQNFRWQAEPVANNTSSPRGSVNLLYGSGTNTPAETGLKIASNGQITFASGQTFPGGSGTVTSVGSGAGLTGGPITTIGTLSIAGAGVTNTMLQHSSVTVSAGSGLKGGGLVALGGSMGLSVNPAVVPELATVNTFTNTNTVSVNDGSPALTLANASGDGLDVTNAGADGVSAFSSGDGGYFNGATGGTYSENDTDSNFSVGAYGEEFGSTQKTFGLFGYSASTSGTGVYGQAVTSSSEGAQQVGNSAIGVWGDTGKGNGIAVAATTDEGIALVAVSNSDTQTASFENFETLNNVAIVLVTGSRLPVSCVIDVSADLFCDGSITSVAPVGGGSRKVALNAISSPESWFEDAGGGQLSNGEAVVTIESVFGETVNTSLDYRVFLTPKGDCKGLYVARESATSFVVRELGGGTSSIAFDYRIMAKRKGFEQNRLVDKTGVMDSQRLRRATDKRPTMPTAEEIRKVHAAHLHSPHLVRPASQAR